MFADIIHPNWHVLLLHFPLALLVAGVVMELIPGRPNGRDAGRWMILLGAIASAPTALSGAYAFREEVAGGEIHLHQSWSEVATSSAWNAAQWEFIESHAWLQSGGAILVLLAVLVGMAGGERTWVRRGTFLVVLIALGIQIVGAWYGGEAVYRLGTGVRATSEPRAVTLEVSILQVHVVGAGIALAVVWLALGRLLNHAFEPRVAEFDAERTTARPALRAGWGVALVLLLGVAAGGVFMVGGGFSAEHLEHWWTAVQDHRRYAAHAILGTALVLSTLIAFAAPRAIAVRRGLSIPFAGLVIVLFGAQAYAGALMLFDSPQGPLIGLQAPAEHPEAPAHDDPADAAAAEPAEGDRRGPPVVEASATPAPALVVEMTNAKTIAPAEARIQVGDLVEWRNVSDVAHTITTDPDEALDRTHVELPDGVASFDSGRIEPGKSWRRRFDVPGRYRYVCVPDEATGMLGTLIVEPR